MCEYPWSNRDLFEYVDDCHIYVPLFNLFMALNIIAAFLAGTYAITELFKRTRKDIALVGSCNEFFFFLSYLWCVSSHQSFADRVVPLNLFYGGSRSMIFLLSNLFTLRTVEVLLVFDKIKLEHDSTLTFLKFIMTRIIVFISTPTELLAFTLPITFPEQLPMADTTLYSQFILSTINLPIGWAYIWKLRQSIKGIKTSRNVYNALEKKLLKMFLVGISIYAIGIGLTLCMIYIPLFHANMYIVYNCIILLGHVSTFRYLYATKSEITAKQNRPSMHGEDLQNTTTNVHHSPSSHPLTRTTTDSNENNMEGSRSQDLPLFNPFSSSPSILTNSNIQLEVIATDAVSQVGGENVSGMDDSTKITNES